MKVCRHFFPAFGFLVLLGVRAHAQSADTQLWTETTYAQTVSRDKKTTLTALTILRGGDDVSRFTDRRIGLQLLRVVSPGLQVGGAFQLRQNDANPAVVGHENRFVLNATYIGPLGKKFSIFNRNLLEYRDQSPAADTLVLRNRIQINCPTRLFKIAVTPWVAGEVFYDFRLKEVPRSRYAVGLNRKFSSNFNAEVYLQRQIEGGGRLGDANIIGFNLRFLR